MPSVSCQISSAVCAGESRDCRIFELLGYVAVLIFPLPSSALSTAPFIPLAPSLQHQLSSQDSQEVPYFHAHRLGHRKDKPVSLAAHTKASAIPVFPLVGSMMTVSFFDETRFLRRLYHGDADSVLHTGKGVEGFDLHYNIRLRPCLHPVEPYQGVFPIVFVISEYMLPIIPP